MSPFYLDDFDGEFELSVGFQVIQHAIEDGRVHVTIAWIARRVAGRVPHDVVSRISDNLKRKGRDIFKK